MTSKITHFEKQILKNEKHSTFLNSNFHVLGLNTNCPSANIFPVYFVDGGAKFKQKSADSNRIFAQIRAELAFI